MSLCFGRWLFFSESLLFFDPSGQPYIRQALAVQTHVSHPCFEPESQLLPNQPYYCSLHVWCGYVAVIYISLR